MQVPRTPLEDLDIYRGQLRELLAVSLRECTNRAAKAKANTHRVRDSRSVAFGGPTRSIRGSPKRHQPSPQFASQLPSHPTWTLEPDSSQTTVFLNGPPAGFHGSLGGRVFYPTAPSQTATSVDGNFHNAPPQGAGGGGAGE